MVGDHSGSWPEPSMRCLSTKGFAAVNKALASRFLGLCMLLALLSACATATRTSIEPADSVVEKFNKVSYNATEVLDVHFMKPVANGYRALMPDPAEKAISRAFSNFREAGSAANNLLQGKLEQAAINAGRVLVNSTLGVLGLFEVAQSMDLEKGLPEDFGQTLAVWGIGSGPYIYLPVLGPSTLRDAPSRVVDYVLNPLSRIDESTARYGLNAADLVQRRAGLLDTEEILRGDRYLFIKDAYLQRREYLIKDGKLLDEPDDFDTDF